MTVDQGLIGGARVKIGDQVIDSSVRGQLAAMAIGCEAITATRRKDECMQLKPSEISELISIQDPEPPRSRRTSAPRAR